MPFSDSHIHKLTIKQWIKQPLTMGLLLLFILPPVGVLWFMGMGWLTIFKRLRNGVGFPLNTVSIFFLGIILASTVSLMTIQDLGPYVYIPVPLLWLGYYGLYLYFFGDMSHSRHHEAFQSYTMTIIVGGSYIYLFDLFLNVCHLKIPSPFDLLTGRALLGSPDKPRLYGPTYNPNLAAYLLLMAFGFSLAYFIQMTKRKHYSNMFVMIASLIMIAIAIFETGSRSALMAMLILVELVLLKMNWKIAIAILLIPFFRIHWFINLIPRNNLIDLSYSNRLKIWGASLQIFREHPIFGVSPAGFSVFYKRIHPKYVPHSHDLFIAFLSEYGIVGESVLLLLTLVLVFYYIKMLLQKEMSAHFYTACFVLTLPIIVLTGLLDHPLFSPQVAIPTVLLISFFHHYALTLQLSPSKSL